jgi:hypothetical protein
VLLRSARNSPSLSPRGEPADPGYAKTMRRFRTAVAPTVASRSIDFEALGIWFAARHKTSTSRAVETIVSCIQFEPTGSPIREPRVGLTTALVEVAPVKRGSNLRNCQPNHQIIQLWRVITTKGCHEVATPRRRNSYSG